MDFKELYRKAEELEQKRAFDTLFPLLYETASQVLRGEKIPIPKVDVEKFLGYVSSAQMFVENCSRGGYWTDALDNLATEINRIGLRIIRKYNVEDLDIKIEYLRMVSSAEPDPVKKEALEKEQDELEDKLIALEESGKKL